ncbi:MAG: polysaccharide deacetylase family protein [Alphaproteobacteria bacterium]|nr:polysaccharide deacetylase family protein [Alphaproteobacteria bacterium]
MFPLRPIVLTVLALAAAPIAQGARAADWASVITYNRFGGDGDGTSSIRLEQFEAHLAEIQRGGYHVMALADLVRALRARQDLPERTIAITIDDSHASIHAEAWPRLRKAGLPFTVFVATDIIDRAAPGYLTWAQLREMAGAGVEIGNLSASYPHLPYQEPARVRAEIAQASARIREETGAAPVLFAYPYGEWSREVRAEVAALGFLAAFGQHSGIVHSGEDWFALPRFAMSESLGSIGRFRLAATALPLRVSDLTPAHPMIESNPPAIGFTVHGPAEGIDRLACFASSQSAPARIERLGERRIEVRLAQPFPPGRTRVNCTMPGPEGRWHWLGLMFLQPTER